MSPWFLYALVLLAYLPGVLALCLWRKCWHFPLLCFAFLGMLFFNAVGSISVFSEDKLYRLNFDTTMVSVDLVLVLVAQAFIFYVVGGAYLVLRPIVRMAPIADGNDRSLLLIGMVIIVLLDAMYYAQAGTFLIFRSLDGTMNMGNALKFREQYVYGLKWWSLYNIGFFFLPLFLSSYALILLQVDRRQKWFVGLVVLVCLGSYITLGSKSGFLLFVLSFSVAYISYFGMVGGAVSNFLRFRKFWFFVGISLVLLYVGYSRAMQVEISPFSFLQQLWYRIFVTYPETLAGALSYFHDFGALGISVLPTMRGLLSHEQISLSVELHRYIAGAPGGVSVPFGGELFLIGGWAGLLATVPLVFGLLIVLQEVSFLAPHRIFLIAFVALYAYLALNISMNGVFASLLTFMYPGVILLLLLSHLALCGLRRAWQRIRA